MVLKFRLAVLSQFDGAANFFVWLMLFLSFSSDAALSSSNRVYIGWFELEVGQTFTIVDQQNFPGGLKRALATVGIPIRSESPLCSPSPSATFISLKRNFVVVAVTCSLEHESSSFVFKLEDGDYRPLEFKVLSARNAIEKVVGGLPNVDVDAANLVLTSMTGSYFCDNCGEKEERDEAYDKVTSYFELNSRNEFDLTSVKQHSHSGKLRRVLWERAIP